jgi:hypothetical protein
MIQEKVDQTCRRLQMDPVEVEYVMEAVLGVCGEMIIQLLDEDGESTFRVDMTVLAKQMQFRIRCTPHEIPDGCEIGTFGLDDETAELLEMESLEYADEQMSEVEGELTEDGTLTITLSRVLTDDQRRDPPMYG